MPNYIVTSNFYHNGKSYVLGNEVEMTEEEAAPNLNVGAIARKPKPTRQIVGSEEEAEKGAEEESKKDSEKELDKTPKVPPKKEKETPDK